MRRPWLWASISFFVSFSLGVLAFAPWEGLASSALRGLASGAGASVEWARLRVGLLPRPSVAMEGLSARGRLLSLRASRLELRLKPLESLLRLRPSLALEGSGISLGGVPLGGKEVSISRLSGVVALEGGGRIGLYSLEGLGEVELRGDLVFSPSSPIPPLRADLTLKVSGEIEGMVGVAAPLLGLKKGSDGLWRWSR